MLKNPIESGHHPIKTLRLTAVSSCDFSHSITIAYKMVIISESVRARAISTSFSDHLPLVVHIMELCQNF